MKGAHGGDQTDGFSLFLTLVYKFLQFADFVAKNHVLPSFPGNFPNCFSATTGQDFNEKDASQKECVFLTPPENCCPAVSAPEITKGHPKRMPCF